MTKTLDLGCGPNPRNTFEAKEVYGVDIKDYDNPNIKIVDLALHPIPFEDNTFDYVTAHDFLEHIPRVLYLPYSGGQFMPRYAFVDLMSEIYRVLKPEGMFMSSTPAWPHAAAFQDPTHVNIITPDTFGEYFDDVKIWGKNYGFKGKFRIEQMNYNGPHLVVIMRKLVND